MIPVVAESSRAGRIGVTLDALLVLLIAIGWIVFVWSINHGRPFVFHDTFRDLAYAHNILGGRVWSDPLISGQPAWYPPGGPMLLAGAAVLAGASVLDAYTSSPYWLNGLIPILLFLIVRAAADRWTALIAALFLPLGSVWWLTHLAAPIASVQGLVFGLLGLLIWETWGARRWSGAAVSGVVLGLAAWVHPLCSAFPIAGVLSTALMPACVRRGVVLSRAFVCAACAVLTAAPLLPVLVVLSPQNPAPHRYFAYELHDLVFALQNHAPLVPLLGLGGAAFLAAKPNRLAWLPGYAFFGIIGQAAGYAAHDLKWPIPYLLPHQFQWHTQLALCLCAAVATVQVGRAVAERRTRRPQSLVRAAVTVAVVLAAVGPALLRAESFRHVWSMSELGPGERSAAEWIAANTALDATFICEAHVGYSFVAGHTGRKLIAVPAGHMNTRLDAEARLAELSRMLATDSAAEFERLARKYNAEYLLSKGSARERFRTWSVLDPVWEDNKGDLQIYRLNADRSRPRLLSLPTARPPNRRTTD